MKVHDVDTLAAALPTLDLLKRPTHEQAMASLASLGALNQTDLAIARFSGQPPWERHPDDELIYVLDGSLSVTLLGEADPTVFELGTGALLVIPAGVWHRSRATDSVTVLAATSRAGSTSSMAEDPRA